MAPSTTVVYTLDISIGGASLSSAHQDLLVSAVVDNSANLPDLAVLEFSDPDAELIGSSGFSIGVPLTIKVNPGDGSPTSIFVGEVTALEAHFDPIGARTVVRAYDKTNRLMRGRKTKAWVQMSYSDIISAIASAAGVPVGTVDSTSHVYDQVSQANVEDWHFCRHLADQVGYRLAVVDGKLELVKPADPTAGEPATLNGKGPLSYYVGDDGLVRVRAVATSAGQVPQASARGWDPKAKQSVVGDQAAQSKAAKIGALSAASMAGTFDAAPFSATWSAIGDQASVAALAKAASDQVASAFAELEAEVVGNPALRPGVTVTIGGIGKLSGSYVLSATRHTYHRHLGYRTEMVASDRQDRSLLGLVAGGGSSEPQVHTMPSVTTAIVTNIEDAGGGMCRVKVKFPWLSDDYESYWARTVQLGAGASRGFEVLPEVNDEVLVAFEHGDFGAPVVLGGLHNGVDTPPMPVAEAVAGGEVVKRMFKSRTGHILLFEESDSASTITLVSKDNKTELILDANKNQATLQAGKDILVTSLGGQVTVTGPTGVTVTSDANISVQAKGNISMEAKGQVSIKGATVSIEGQGPVTVKGALVDVEGQGPVQVKGAIVKIN
ncbi:MAG: VgrG-related protein [Acidimicrobiales bacterium]